MYSPINFLTVVPDISLVAEEALVETSTAEAMEKSEVIEKSFELMGKGLLGIFVTIAIIMISVYILTRISKGKKTEAPKEQ